MSEATPVALEEAVKEAVEILEEYQKTQNPDWWQQTHDFDCLEGAIELVAKGISIAEEMGYEPVWGEEDLPGYGTRQVIIENQVIHPAMAGVATALKPIAARLRVMAQTQIITPEGVQSVMTDLPLTLVPIRQEIDWHREHERQQEDAWDNGW